MEPQPITQLPLGRAAALLRIGEHLLFLVLVPLAVLRALGPDGTGEAAGVLVIGLVILLWYGIGVWRDGGMIWVVGLVGFTLMALGISADFAWVSFAVFVALANALAPRAAVLGVLTLGLVTGGLLLARWPGDTHPIAPLLGPMVGAVVVLGLVGSARLAASEAAQRQRLVDELVAAHDRLALANLTAGARSERERLSREIHDTLAQDLTSIVLTSRRSRRALDDGDHDQVRTDLHLMAEVGGRAIEAARRLVRELPPAELADSPLTEALATLTESADPDTTLVEVRIEEGEGAPPSTGAAVDAALLRIAQEAVVNARRHADADRIVVTLTSLHGAVSLDVTDDGSGFDPSRPYRDRFGLVGMRGRAEALGGVFTVESSPGAGTTVNATIPTPIDGVSSGNDAPMRGEPTSRGAAT